MASTSFEPAKPNKLPNSVSCLKPIILEELKRYGNSGDGGYLLPASRVSEIDGVISFGLANDWSLEKELSNIRPGIPIHVYDHTVGEAVFRQEVKSALRDIAVGVGKLCLFKTSISGIQTRLHTYRRRQAVYRDYKEFFPARAKHFEQRVFNRHEKHVDATIEDIFARLQGKAHLFLKMDIEGGEYRMIPQILQHANSIDLLVIEFHDTDPLRELFLRLVKEILVSFEIFHIHGNNCGSCAPDGLPELLEISFLNRNFLHGSYGRRDRLPIAGLDTPNDPSKADLPLIFS